MSNTNDLPAETGLNLGWDEAAELLNSFGPIAANFAEAIRMLSAAHVNGADLDLGGSNHIARLIKNDTLKATYYYFAKQFKPTLLKTARGKLSNSDIINGFTPIDHAAVLSLCYLSKNLSKKVDLEEWEYVKTPLYEALFIGGNIGLAVKEVGLGIGLLTRGIRYLAFAALLKDDRKGFKEYRQHLKNKDLAFDSKFELDVWKCTTIQLASLLLERIGFPRTTALQFVYAASKTSSINPDTSFGIPFRISECLTEAYMEGDEIPEVAPLWVGDGIKFSPEVRGNLLIALRESHHEEKGIEWLNKSSSDLSPETTPELF
jgi:hypothetical protein